MQKSPLDGHCTIPKNVYLEQKKIPICGDKNLNGKVYIPPLIASSMLINPLATA